MRTFLRILALPAIVTAAVAWAGHRRGLPAGELALALPTVFALLAGMFALGLRAEVTDRLARWVRGSPWRILALGQTLWVPYLLYALPLGAFTMGGFFHLLVYVNLPLAVLLPVRQGSPPEWRDAVAVALIWIPLEFRLLGPLWSWPFGQPGDFLNGILGTCLAAYLFVVVRGLPGIGYTFAIRRRDLLWAGLSFLGFAPIAITIGFFTEFLRPGTRFPGVLASVGTILGIFLVTGVPEELLFRGLLQNLLQHWVPRPVLSLTLAALIFGLAHLNGGSHADWRLWLLATLAGFAYGTAYRLGGSLMAPTLTHTLTNSLWVLLFRR